MTIIARRLTIEDFNKNEYYYIISFQKNIHKANKCIPANSHTLDASLIGQVRIANLT